MPQHVTQACPICKLPDQVVRESDHGERQTLRCPCCGNFTITRTAGTIAERRKLGPKLSAWIRDQTEADSPLAEINSDTLESLPKSLPNYTVLEKQLLLLRAIARKSEYPGQEVTFTPRLDYPLAWASGQEEFGFHVGTLAERNLLRLIGFGPGTASGRPAQVVSITADGWKYLDEHNRSNVIIDQAFVAMSFADELKPAWTDGIAIGLAASGYRPYRTDAAPHIDRIDFKIITEIRNSRFLVADVTQQRPGVYFEAGYAIGLGLPVFWSVRKDDLVNVHFDTRQYNHIVWESPDDLAKHLELFVTAIVGRGGAI